MNQPSDHLRTTAGLESHSAKELLRLNYWCDQFEAAWRQQSEVDLANFLQRVPIEEQAGLANELVLIDIEIRNQRVLPAPLEQYVSVAVDLPREWLATQIARRQSSTSSSRLNELPAGHQLGDYTILSQLGSGGMGIVYRAEHRLMKRQVALKVIQHRSHCSRLAERRFEREVRAAAQLAHPNIVVAHDARQMDGWIYLVTELIEGEDLDSLIQRSGPLSVTLAIDLALQTARGLEYAHEQGIIHRDIKPANLLIDTQQRVKILDLGLARWLNDTNDASANSDDASLTSSFEMLGTAQFMSPEQARSAASADQRSDIYSLGCTLFFMLTGQPPYGGLSRLEICMAHLNAPIPSAADLVMGIPAVVDELIQSWMAKAPEDRPSSMTQVIQQLETILKPKAKGISPPPSPFSSTGGFSSMAGTLPTRPLSQSDPSPDAGLSRTWRPSRRVALISAVAASAVGLTALGWRTMNAWQWATEVNDPIPVAAGRIADASAPGLRLQGDGYLEVPEFQVPIENNMALEALVRPGFNRSPANVVTWTGPKSLVLFCDESTRWGVAYFDGQRPRLIVADVPIERSSAQLVAATWEGQQLQLRVDGQLINSHPIPYVLVPATPRLYIGGIPSGVIPENQGMRYFQGDICAVRILQSKQALQLAANPTDLAVTPQTLALFDFANLHPSSSAKVLDLTVRWQGHMRWTLNSER